jgi:hypothetical protein
MEVNQFQADDIIVACEGIPALFYFIAGSTPEAPQVIPLKGNALDVTFIERTIIVSIDHVHIPGSTNKIRAEEVSTPRDNTSKLRANQQPRNPLDYNIFRAITAYNGKRMTT